VELRVHTGRPSLLIPQDHQHLFGMPPDCDLAAGGALTPRSSQEANLPMLVYDALMLTAKSSPRSKPPVRRSRSCPCRTPSSHRTAGISSVS
jgi:hypothetical protein